MADQPKKTSELLTSASVGVNDRFVILYEANTTAPSTRTISANNLILTLFAGSPVYADQAAANTAGLQVGAIYQTVTGEIRIVI